MRRRSGVIVNGDRILRQRRQKCVTQVQVAELAGVSAWAVARTEHSLPVHPRTAKAVIDALDSLPDVLTVEETA
jgi:hypothetical protein